MRQRLQTTVSTGGSMPPPRQTLPGLEQRAVLERKFAQLTQLSSEAAGVVGAMVRGGKVYEPSSVVLGPRMESNRPRFLLSGWACRQHIFEDGQRQIFCFVLPGDVIVPDCAGLLMGSIVALTPVVVTDGRSAGTINSDPRWDAFTMLAVNRAAQEREELLRRQVVRLGAMTALQRTADLLLELWERLSLVGLSDSKAMPFPLRQETLADGLGLSSVHVNRTFKQLRRQGAITMLSRQRIEFDPVKLSGIIRGDRFRKADSAPERQGALSASKLR